MLERDKIHNNWLLNVVQQAERMLRVHNFKRKILDAEPLILLSENN